MSSACYDVACRTSLDGLHAHKGIMSRGPGHGTRLELAVGSTITG